jgi:hypothetical protein
VTFLLTDIEGSTALWEQAGEAFQAALATHHQLLRQEFLRHGGCEVKEAGDSFLVAFERPSHALACAVAGQEALAASAAPSMPVRVRMALHTGEVNLEQGEYQGRVPHRAARMLTAAHGGQILCSEAVAGLVRRDLELGVRLADLGVYRLRDIPSPERLFQVEYPGMPLGPGGRVFPPLRAEAGYAGSLPLQVTRFFGREQEIARLVEMLGNAECGMRNAECFGPEAPAPGSSRPATPHSALRTPHSALKTRDPHRAGRDREDSPGSGGGRQAVGAVLGGSLVRIPG